MEKKATKSTSAQGVSPEEQKFWELELDAAIDDCLEACDLSDVLSLTTVYACLRKGEEADLHEVTQNTSPRMHAALQNLADILVARPHLARQGCAVLRGKPDAKLSANLRKLLTGILPPDDDPMFSEPWRVMAITRTFLDDEERAGLVSEETKARILWRRDRTRGHLVTRK